MHDMSKQHYMNCHVLTVVISHDLQVLFNTTISHSSSLLCRLPSRTQGVHANGKDGKTQKLRFEHMYSGQAQQEDLLSSLKQSVATVAATD